MDSNKANIIVAGGSGMIGSALSTMLGGTYNTAGFDRAWRRGSVIASWLLDLTAAATARRDAPLANAGRGPRRET